MYLLYFILIIEKGYDICGECESQVLIRKENFVFDLFEEKKSTLVQQKSLIPPNLSNPPF